MRSKLLSLHLVLTVLDNHMPIFVDSHALIFSNSNNEATTPFLQAVKQYLCLALSRNAISSVPQVFDISVEIFWRILNGLRTKLKVSLDKRACEDKPERRRVCRRFHASDFAVQCGKCGKCGPMRHLHRNSDG